MVCAFIKFIQRETMGQKNLNKDQSRFENKYRKICWTANAIIFLTKVIVGWNCNCGRKEGEKHLWGN